MLQLPPEILDNLIRSCGDIDDAIALVMTNKMLYCLGFAYIQRWIAGTIAPLAGSRLVCVAEAGVDNEVPPGCTPKIRRR